MLDARKLRKQIREHGVNGAREVVKEYRLMLRSSWGWLPIEDIDADMGFRTYKSWKQLSYHLNFRKRRKVAEKPNGEVLYSPDDVTARCE